MYFKPFVGGSAAFFGAAALPAREHALRAARLLLEITGAGFWLYCMVALALVPIAMILRGRARDAEEDR